MSRFAPFTTAVMAYTLLGMALARAAWGERRMMGGSINGALTLFR
jgi:hypothetical protein